MITLPVTPMSQNKAYLGRKTKSKEYRVYTGNIVDILPAYDIPEGELDFKIDVHYSNRAADIDNCLKPFIDILQFHYGFNDNKIYHLDVTKHIVPKGEEKMAFDVKPYDPDASAENLMYRVLYEELLSKIEKGIYNA